jgi:hypothetical protein
MSLNISQLNWDGLTQFLQENNASWNTAIIVLLIVLAVFYFGAGLGKTAKGIMSVYVALAIVNTVSYFKPEGPEVNIPGVLVLKLGSFVGLSIVILMLISRYSFHPVMRVELSGNVIERTIFAVLGSGMLVAILMSFLPPEIMGTITPVVRAIFNSDVGFAVWLIGPLVGLLFVKSDK